MSIIYRYRPSRHQYSVGGRRVLFVDSPEKIERVVKMLDASTKVGVDVESSGFNIHKEHPYHRAQLVSTQFTCAGSKLEGVPESDYIFVPNWGKHEGLYRHFKPFLEEERRTKILHNAKSDMHVFANRGIRMRGLLSDTMVKAYLRNTAEPHGLKEQCNLHLDTNLPGFVETFSCPKLKMNGEPGKQTVTPDLMAVVAGHHDYAYPEGGIRRLVEYGVKDPYLAVKYNEWVDKALADIEWHGDKSMLDYYLTFEQDYTACLFDMERKGFPLNVELLQEIQETVTEKVVKLERGFFRRCVKMGASPAMMEDFNLGSTKQLGELLEGKFGFDLPKTPTGKPGTSDSALEQVRSPRARRLITTLLEWRSLNDKLLGTYIEPFLRLTEEDWSGNRLRTQFNHCGTRTMRLSSAHPNLQNIPRPGEDQADPFGIRGAFVAEPGCVIGDADLSQVELRLAAHFTGEPKMLEAFHNGWDLHSLTTTICFQEVEHFIAGRDLSAELLKEVAELFKPQRSASKNVNFMTLYGGGPGRYAEMQKSTRQEGKRVINAFFKSYPGLAVGIERVKKGCRRNGYVRTLLRRYCHIPEITSSDHKIRGYAERRAFNYVIQGSQAELIKMAMLLVYRDDRLKNDLGVDMLLQVHDELAFNVPKGSRKRAKPIIEDYMSNPQRHFGLKDLKIPTPADLAYGTSWLEAH